jgi:phosphoenolpyruvate---glycerone phosphotransferase subunit DhaL
MEWFFNKDGYIVIKEIISAIQSNKEYLSRIDGEIGDGDHGINMNKGFTIASERINDNSNLSEGFNEIAKVLMMEIGGSMGPIYGTFFEVLSEKSHSFEKIDSRLFYEMINSATNAVIDICEAQVGDKTLIDTLAPAIAKFKLSIEKNHCFKVALWDMVEGAREGRDSTLDMIAKKGRSARLGARSKGVIDAGSASCFIILETLATTIIKILKNDLSVD